MTSVDDEKSNKRDVKKRDVILALFKKRSLIFGELFGFALFG